MCRLQYSTVLQTHKVPEREAPPCLFSGSPGLDERQVNDCSTVGVSEEGVFIREDMGVGVLGEGPVAVQLGILREWAWGARMVVPCQK